MVTGDLGDPCDRGDLQPGSLTIISFGAILPLAPGHLVLPIPLNRRPVPRSAAE